MATVKSIIPSKRRITVMFAFFALLAILFGLFQFYYIPSNKQKRHEYGFMVLNRIQQNINERDQDLRKLYTSTVKNELGKSVVEIQAKLLAQEFTDRFFSKRHQKNCSGSITLNSNLTDSCIGFGFDEDIDGWSRQYLFATHHKKGIDTFALGLSMKAFLEPALSYRNEIFESYMLINQCSDSHGVIFYHDNKWGIGDKVMKDSILFASKSVNFSRIAEVNIKGTAYKIFTYPFEMGEQTLLLCGLVSADAYNNSIRLIPAGLIYPVVILILVLLVILPFIKPYMMSAREKLKLEDVYFMFVALFAGLTLITLLVIQSLILGANAIKETKELEKLSGQLESHFIEELNEAYEQLNFFDHQLEKYTLDKAKHQLNSNGFNIHTQIKPDDIQSFKIPVTDITQKRAPYYYFDRVIWMNDSGKQIFKSQIDSVSGYQFINVKERSYFKMLKENKAHLLPGNSERQFVLDPIYSWTAGDFKVNISKKSILNRRDSAAYAVLVTRLYSMVQTIFPSGYGYALMNDKGDVLMHSNMNRNLRENFIDEAGGITILKEAIAARQAYYINRVLLYGKPHALYVSPVKQLPYYLAVFHDKTYRIPINMRILSFSLVLIFMYYLIGYIALLLYRKSFQRIIPFSVFKPAITYRTWMLPSESLKNFYITGILFIIGYIFIFLAVRIVGDQFRQDSYVTLMMALGSPVWVLGNLFVLGEIFRKPSAETTKSKAFFYGLGMMWLLTFLLIFLLPFENKKEKVQFFSFALPWLILPIVLYKLKLNDKIGYHIIFHKKISENQYLNLYSVFILKLIICFAIVPAAVFTWYAHNFEIKQSVKKQQLSLSAAIQQRREGIKKFFRHHHQPSLPKQFYAEAQYKHGVYSIYDESIWETTQPFQTEKEVATYLNVISDSIQKHDKIKGSKDLSETFYLTLADQLSRNYKDPSYYPALSNTSKDSTWYWFGPANNMIYFYRSFPYKDKLTAEDTMLVPGIVIRTALPKRFEILTHSGYFIVLMVGVILFLWLLALLIKNTAVRIFLMEDKVSPISWLNTHQQAVLASQNLFDATEKEMAVLNRVPYVNTGQYQLLKDDYTKDDATCFALMEQHQEVFDAIWDKCSDPEKLLLLDLAQDGLINYRNTEEIRALFKKGILIMPVHRIKMFSNSFGYYLRSAKFEAEKIKLNALYFNQGSWSSFRTPLLIIILSIAIFIFATQEEVWNKLIGLAGSLTVILSLLQRFISEKGDAVKTKS